jgi:hypothetical protein
MPPLQVNRVVLKVDIPQEHHFSVIGKKGDNQRAVMSSTGTYHFHFPLGISCDVNCIAQRLPYQPLHDVHQDCTPSPLL